MLTAVGCSSTEWEELPDPIAEFVAQYFPGDGVEHYGNSDGTYYVELKGSAGMSFDSNYSWITVNGRGMPLPQVFLFDQLPPALYEYVQEAESVNAVYSVSRSSRTYDVTLADSNLTYDILTKEVKQEYPA